MDQNKSLRGVAEAVARIMMGEKALHPNQQKLDVHEPEKDELTSADFKKLRSMKKEEIEELDEGKMGQLAADLKDLSHDEFTKEYGKPKSHFDPTNFKKPVQPGKEMDRAKALAQRGMTSMKKEEVEEVDEGIMDKVKGILGKKEKSTNLFDQPHVKKDTAAYLKASAKNPNGPPVRNLMAKEEVEDLSEATYVVKHDGVADDHADADAKKLFAGKTNVNSHVSRYASSAEKHADMLKSKGFKNVRIQTMNKEQVEELDEMFPGTPEYEKKYGKAPQDMKPGEKKATTKGEMEKTEKGVVHKRKFSEMLEVYGDDGIKGLFEALQDKEELIEEPTNAEFTAELDDAKKRAAGTKKQPDVAKGAVQAVKNEEVESVEEQTHTSVSVIDYNDINGVKFSEIDLSERELTDAEMENREKNVKGMKKSMEGFKERYGKDAKSVMYATATKMAKEK